MRKILSFVLPIICPLYNVDAIAKNVIGMDGKIIGIDVNLETTACNSIKTKQ